MTALELSDVTRTYEVTPPVHALRGITFAAHAGQSVAVVGRSGSGKSTLLNVLGLLDEPTSGTYTLLGEDTARLTGRARDQFRARSLGFVFQESHVLGHRTAAENLHLRLAIAHVPPADRAALVARALERVDLAHRARALGRLLSGGERQRLAVARATITQPRVLLADEPTGNLDDVNAATVLAMLAAQAAAGAAVVVITHDARTAAWADTSFRLEDGQITPASVVPHGLVTS